MGTGSETHNGLSFAHEIVKRAVHLTENSERSFVIGFILYPWRGLFWLKIIGWRFLAVCRVRFFVCCWLFVCVGLANLSSFERREDLRFAPSLRDCVRYVPSFALPIDGQHAHVGG